MALVEADNVERWFQDGTQKIYALRKISLCVDVGDFYVITGPSGSGKSTLLNLLSGLDRPSNGKIFHGRASLSEMTEKQLAELRNTCFGYIFQTAHLLPEKTVLENILLPFHYGMECDREESRLKCIKMLEYLGMKDMADRYPKTLSGGEMQRVVFARALSRDPTVIFADEPTGSLDGVSSEKILRLLQEQAKSGRTVIMVSHDPVAIQYGTNILSLDKFGGKNLDGGN